MHRLLPLLLVASLASGCTARQRLAMGGAAVVTGVILAAQPVETTWTICAPGECETISDAWYTSKKEDSTLRDTGVMLLVTGLVLALHGLASIPKEDRAEEFRAEAARHEAEREARRVAAARRLPPPPKAPPAPPPSVESRLAMQASLIAKTGNCDGARATAQRLAEIDADAYAHLLLTDEAVARCSNP